jgi:lysophospholipase L1-like esterase
MKPINSLVQFLHRIIIKRKICTLTKVILKSYAIIIFLIHGGLIMYFGIIISTPFLSISFFILASWITIYIIKSISLDKDLKQKLILNTILTFIFVFIIDIGLRYIPGHNQGYMESNGNMFYFSAYRFHNLWNTDQDDSVEYTGIRMQETNEFIYHENYNNLGFRGQNILEKKPKECRIAFLGDSFIQGIGTPDDSTVPYLCQKILSSKFNNITTINMGRMGSDPPAEFQLLKKYFASILPDVVVLTINSSDINAMLTRGGFERYRNDGSIHATIGPWWEIFYASSFIFRTCIHKLGYDALLMKNSKRNNILAAKKLTESIIATYTYTKKQNVSFVLVINPLKEDIKAGRFLHGLDMTERSIKVLDKFPQISLLKEFKSKGLNADNSEKYYWKNDGHFNSKGYEIFAQCVVEHLIRLNEIKQNSIK